MFTICKLLLLAVCPLGYEIPSTTGRPFSTIEILGPTSADNETLNGVEQVGLKSAATGLVKQKHDHDAADQSIYTLSVRDDTLDSTSPSMPSSQAIISDVPDDMRPEISAGVAISIITASVIALMLALAFGFWLYYRRKKAFTDFKDNSIDNKSLSQGSMESGVLPVTTAERQTYAQKADVSEVENPFAEPPSNWTLRSNSPCREMMGGI